MSPGHAVVDLSVQLLHDLDRGDVYMTIILPEFLETAIIWHNQRFVDFVGGLLINHCVVKAKGWLLVSDTGQCPRSQEPCILLSGLEVRIGQVG